MRGRRTLSSLGGPYNVIEAFPQTSNYKLELPTGDRAHPVFHASNLKVYTVDSPTASSRNSLLDFNRSSRRQKGFHRQQEGERCTKR
jgi:hypothetical protein